MTQAVRDILKSRSLPQAFLLQAGRRPDAVVFRARSSRAAAAAVTWQEARASTQHLAAALMRRGFRAGDRAAIMADNGPAWGIVDLAIQAAGGAAVPIYCSSSDDQIGHILKDSAAAFLFAGSERYLRRAAPVLKSINADARAVMLEGTEQRAQSAPDALAPFLGDPPTPAELAAVAERTDALTREHVSSIIYTSGTTGLSKGAVLTHGNILANIQGAMHVFPIDEDDLFLSLLPMSHSFERSMGFYAPLLAGASIHFCESPAAFTRDIQEVGPTVIMVVPRLLEKMQQKVAAGIDSLGGAGGMLARRALAVRLTAARRAAEGRRCGPLLWAGSAAAAAVIGPPVRRKLGGRLRLLFSGGAALSREVWAFFHAIGVRVVQGYGLTETAPVLTVNPPDAIRAGSVGKPLKNVEIKIAEDGEILARGPNIMKGYHNLSEETAQAIDPEGYFHTGDIGAFDPDGYLSITDRKKDILVSASGKNIAPQHVENILCQSALIEYACVVGEGKNYLAAVLSPDFEALGEQAARLGVPAADRKALVAHPDVARLFHEEVERANARLAPYERVFRFHLAEAPFSIDAGEITSTLKVRRRAIQEKYGAQIEGLFGR